MPFWFSRTSTGERRFQNSSDAVIVGQVGDRRGSVRVDVRIADPGTVAFDSVGDRLLVLQPAARQLVEIAAASDGSLDTDRLARHEIRGYGLRSPRGLTVDPLSGRLFILDGVGPRVFRIEPGPDLDLRSAAVSQIELQQIGRGDVRGLAFDPASGHLHILSPAERRLYEFTEVGELVAIRDLSGFGLSDPQAVLFGPSGDLTDAPSQTSLYVLDRGHVASQDQGATPTAGDQVVELSFLAPVSVAATAVATLVQTIDMSMFSPPSPDPAGIAYIASSDTLLVSDSEVDEMSIFSGDNLFEMTRFGSLVDTATTVAYSREPTGVAVNPANQHIFISDDNTRKIFEVNPGPDGLRNTSDDTVTSLDTMAFNSGDPEGVTFDSWQGVLFIVDGVNSEVYRVSPGVNGVFDGVPPAGDDQVVSFDTQTLGVTDPEGITFDTDSGHLYIVGEPTSALAEVTTSGILVQMIDISAAGARLPAGLAYGPSSPSPSMVSIYISDRGVDNNNDPDENDGRVFEMLLGSVTPGNEAPVVTISAPSDGANFDQGEVIGFAGSASDGEDGDLTASLIWSSSLDGPIGTGGTFSRSDLSVGVHAITATVTDSEGSSGTDQITLIVHEVYTGPVVTIGTPSDGASFNEGETISFAGSASDGEDGDLTAGLTWSSSLDGLIGTGGTFSRSDLSVGVHAITATVTDSEGLTAVDQIVLTVGSSVTTLEVRVAASSDDAEETASGRMSLTSSDLELVYDGSDQTVGIRFNGVTIPQGASIRSAYVQFQVDEFELRCDVADDRGGGYRQRRDVHVSGPKHLVAATHRGGDGLASRSLGDDRSIGSRSANAGYQLNRPGDCEPSRLDHGQLAGNHHHGEW